MAKSLLTSALSSLRDVVAPGTLQQTVETDNVGTAVPGSRVRRTFEGLKWVGVIAIDPTNDLVNMILLCDRPHRRTTGPKIAAG